MISAARMGDPRADMRGGHRERWFVAGMPVVLVSRVEDVSEVSAYLRTDQRAAIHHFCHVFEPLAHLDVVDDCINRRERAQHLIALEPLIERSVTLGVKCLGRRHAPSHPAEDHGVGCGRKLRLILSECGERGRAECRGGAFQKFTAIHFHLHISLTDQLEFGKHHNDPEKIGGVFGGRFFA